MEVSLNWSKFGEGGGIVGKEWGLFCGEVGKFDVSGGNEVAGVCSGSWEMLGVLG